MEVWNRRFDGGFHFLMTDFIDSHAHLADAAFDGDRDEVIARARAAGARAMICIGESLATAERARDLARNHPQFLFFTAGVHPHDAATFSSARDLPRLEEALRGGARAVGECGLDYHYDNSPRLAQREAFEAQLDAARRLRLPVVSQAAEVTHAEGKLTVKRQTEFGYDVIEAPLPAVIAVSDAINEPRYPSLKGIMGAKSKPQETVSLADLGVDGVESRTEVYALNDPPARGDSRRIDGDGNAAQAVLDFLAEKRLV